MNRFAGVIITVVAIAALIGAALGWRFPFPGSRSETASVNGRSSQRLAAGQPRLAAGQPKRTVNAVGQQANTTTARNGAGTTVAENSNSTSPQIPDDTTGGNSSTNDGVPAMW
ncbi:MAG TPA: hypothetical protein V6C85_31980 [Allocoleopsis sp.]